MVVPGKRWLRRGRALFFGVLLVVAFVLPLVASAKPTHPPAKPAGKASASAPSASAPVATVAPIPSVDFWNGQGPPPEKAPPPPPPPPVEQEFRPAKPSEEGIENSRRFAMYVLAGGGLFVLAAIGRMLRASHENEPGLASNVPNQPAAPFPQIPSPAQSNRDLSASMAPQQQAYVQPVQQAYGPASMPPQAQYAPQGQYGPPSIPQGGYGPASMPPQAQVVAADSPRVGEIVGDKYRIDSVLGRDDLGVKYAVTFATLGQACSIYVLRQEFTGSPQHYARMSEIARASAANPQPGFQVFDMGQLPDSRPYLVIR